MPAPYDFMSFIDDSEGPDSNFLDLYNRFSNQPDLSPPSYLDPNDPDIKKYQELASSPTGSEELLADYTGRRPSLEDYHPSFGRKMASFLFGTLSGDPRNASKFLYQPYTRDLEEWKSEGTNLATRARLKDAERARELSALKYGIQTKGAAARAEAVDEYRKDQEARRMAAAVQAEKEKKDKAERDAEQTKIMNEARDRQFHLSEQIHRDLQAQRGESNTRLEEEKKARDKKEAEDAAKLTNINKQLAAFASQHGIDTSDRSALDMARMVAFKRAKDNPAFADLLEEVDDGYRFVEPKYGTDRIRILKNYINSLTAKYLQGRFE